MLEIQREGAKTRRESQPVHSWTSNRPKAWLVCETTLIDRFQQLGAKVSVQLDGRADQPVRNAFLFQDARARSRHSALALGLC
ncbi:MAG: hypothetical protein PVI15_08950 [Chromatiales bacterium]|jgi:hypothetical protein